MCLLTKAVCFVLIVGWTVSTVLALSTDDSDSSVDSANNDRVIDLARGIENDLVQSSVLYGVLSEIENNNLSESRFCQRDVSAILNGIFNRDLWAIKRDIQFLEC